MAFDVYSVIRSEEVRDHARKYWNLRPEDKVLLIHFSFFPIEKRYELLKEYAGSLKEEDAKRYAEEFVLIYRMVIDHIYHPAERVLYLCEMARPSAMAYRPEEEPARGRAGQRKSRPGMSLMSVVIIFVGGMTAWKS